MKIERTGIILNTKNHHECVKFYQELFNLPVLFEKSEGDFALCCLAFGESYIMVETGGIAVTKGKSIHQSPIKIRFNVADIDAALKHLVDNGVNAKIEYYGWGSTINLHDPDGNRIGIRDESKFIEDVEK